MKDCYEQIGAFLQNPLEEQEIFEDSDVLIWVDWKECDEATIDYFNEKLFPKDQITVTFETTTEARGVDIFLQHNGVKMRIPYHTDYTERDITIKAMQQMMVEHYQIRWYMESLGGDTLAFVVLTNDAWAQLEATYGKAKVLHYFTPVTSALKMFNMSMEEVEGLLAARAQSNDA